MMCQSQVKTWAHLSQLQPPGGNLSAQASVEQLLGKPSLWPVMILLLNSRAGHHNNPWTRLFYVESGLYIVA